MRSYARSTPASSCSRPPWPARPDRTPSCAGDDAWVSIAVGNQTEWEALCRTVGRPELAADPRFCAPGVRWQNQDQLRPVIEAWTSKLTHWDATERLQAVGVAAAPSFTFEDLANDRHVVER